MSKFELDKTALEVILDKSIFTWANLFENLSLGYAPRIKESLPGNINLKSWNTPQRNIRKDEKGTLKNKHYYRKPVMIDWNYYEWVTWNLRRSIWIQKLWQWEYIIWVKVWPASDYAATHEFWDEARNIPKRSFLRRPLEDDSKEIIKQIWNTFKQLSDKL